TASCPLLSRRWLAVHLFDLGGPVLFHRAPPYLHRGRQLARFDGELARQQPELLDPLELRQVAVEPVDDFPVERQHVVAADQLEALAGRAAEVLEAPLQRGELRDDQRRREATAIAEDDDLGDERAALQRRLDRLRRDLLAAGGVQQILLAIRDRQVAVGVERADVAGVEPAVLEDGGGLVRLVVVAQHHVRAARQDLAVLGNPYFDVGNRLADRAEPRRVE